MAAANIADVSALATTENYTAAGFGSWSTVANWSPASVPTMSDNAVILQGGGGISITGTRGIQTLTFMGSTDRAIGNDTNKASTLNIYGDGGVDPLINVTSTGNFTISNANLGSGTAGMLLAIGDSGDINVANANAR